MKKQEISNSICQFRDAYRNLRSNWDKYGLNDLEAVSKYPFDQSFDEINVDEWCNDMLVELSLQLDFKILATDYVNTGGNCMVHTAKVYLPAEKRIVYVYSSDNASSINRCDWLLEDIDYEDNFCEDTMDWDEPKDEHKYYDLIQECRVLCMIADHKHYGTRFELRYDQMPPSLLRKLSPSELEYLIESEELVETDGVNVNIPSLDDNVKAAKNCLKSLDRLMDLMDTDNNKFLDVNFKIYVGDELFEFYNAAAIYTGIQDAMKYVIDQE